MMNYCDSKRFILVTLLVLLAFSSLATSGHAIRLLSESEGANNASYDTMYVKARSTMAYWLERLASGPSGGGGGH